MPIELKVAKDFSRTPGPRFIKEGDFSGELFRKTVLFPAFEQALQQGAKLVVDLDHTAGYGTSFLEEAFGGLIRIEKLPYKKVIETLQLISKEEDYLIEDILHYIEDAEKERSKG